MNRSAFAIESLGPLPDAFGLANLKQAEEIEDGFCRARARVNESPSRQALEDPVRVSAGY